MIRALFLLLAALTASLPAYAQTVPSYPYPSAGTPPMVQLQCNDALTACLPIASTNPLPVRGTDAAESAFRAGRAFTISTGRATVANGNVLCIYLENTGVETYTLTGRLFSHNLPLNVAQPYSFGISGLTGGNLPPVTGTATNRNGSATAPGLIIRYGVSTVANQPTGTVGPGNWVSGSLMLGEAFSRTLLPGARFANCIEGAATGLTGNTDAQEAITITAFY